MTDRVLRGLTIAFVGALAAIGFDGSILVGGVAWLGFLFCVASGWGYLVARIARVEDPDFALRVAWGLAGYVAVGGLALAIGICTRPVILGLVAIGFAGFAWRELVTPVAIWQHKLAGLRYVRAHPALGGVAIVLGAVALFHLLGGVAQLDRDPWDDDIAYTPFVKRLLDIGNLVEPFSFRRLGAYGGQTMLQALAAVRGQLANVHLIDKGLCQGLALLLAIGHARDRKTPALWVALIALLFVLMPEIAINTASYWSGVALFLALYRTVAADRWAIAGLVGAATCTLRMNYLAIVVLFLVIALAFRRDRRAWLWTIVVGAAALIPYMIAAFVSSRTFLFPIMEGTWNHALSLRQGSPNWLDEIRFIAWCAIDTAPIVVWPALAAIFVLARDSRPARPFTAFTLASGVGFLLLVHGLVGAEPSHVWRYAFAFTTALLAVGIAELGNTDDFGVVRLPLLGRWVLLACVGLQLLTGRAAVAKQVSAIVDDIRAAAHGDPEAALEQRHYAALQAAIPAGESVAIMLDDPTFLDFSRNDIANLDTAGFASPGEQLPGFEGAEALRSYLRAQGIAYLAFVRPESSRYFYRREFWVQRMFTDTELFQIMSAYAIDTIDSCVQLATTQPVRYAKDGLVVVDLGGPVSPVADARSEPERRDAWMRELARARGMLDIWTLTPRANVQFKDGFGAVQFVDPGAPDAHWFDAPHPSPPATRGTPVRWVQRRAHLRVQGHGDMRLAIRGRLNITALYTHPRLLVALDSDEIAEVVAATDGTFAIDARVTTTGWHDIYLSFSSIGEPERDLRDLRMGRVEAVEWE